MRVECDLCCKDFTDLPDTGGVYGITTKAICPECAPRIVVACVEYGETDYLFAQCPPGMAFAEWVIKYLRHGRIEPAFDLITWQLTHH